MSILCLRGFTDTQFANLASIVDTFSFSEWNYISQLDASAMYINSVELIDTGILSN